MNLWQIKAMQERDALTAVSIPDPAEAELKTASSLMSDAIREIEKGSDLMSEAVGVLKGFPMSYKVESMITDLERIMIEIGGLSEIYGRGVRE